jgi:hypothetical protein
MFKSIIIRFGGTDWITLPRGCFAAAGRDAGQWRPAARTMQQSSRTVPVIFISGTDPVTDGLVLSLAHPEGNLTGLQILLDLVFCIPVPLLRHQFCQAHERIIEFRSGSLTTVYCGSVTSLARGLSDPRPDHGEKSYPGSGRLAVAKR